MFSVVGLPPLTVGGSCGVRGWGAKVLDLHIEGVRGGRWQQTERSRRGGILGGTLMVDPGMGGMFAQRATFVLTIPIQGFISFHFCNVLGCGPPPQTSTTSGITEGSNSFW